jgi:hypothetical protein
MQRYDTCKIERKPGCFLLGSRESAGRAARFFKPDDGMFLGGADRWCKVESQKDQTGFRRTPLKLKPDRSPIWRWTVDATSNDELLFTVKQAN